MDVTLEYLAIASILGCTCLLKVMGMVVKEALSDSIDCGRRKRQGE